LSGVRTGRLSLPRLLMGFLLPGLSLCCIGTGFLPVLRLLGPMGCGGGCGGGRHRAGARGWW